MSNKISNIRNTSCNPQKQKFLGILKKDPKAKKSDNYIQSWLWWNRNRDRLKGQLGQITV